MAKTDNLSDFLTDVANAIRTKKGTTTLINPQDFSDEILSIVSSAGGDMKTLIDGSIETLTESDLSEITTIRSFAFYGCENLTTVTIPSNIMTIGNNAFEGCSNLQTLIISDGVQMIGSSAFKDINASVINIPSTLLVLENEVFANNTALTSITIPSNITNIKDNAFGGCTNLTEITMESLTPPSVSDTAFPSNVTSIYVEYGAYDDYKSQWTAYADKIVRLPAIPSTITVIVNNYLNELVNGASVTITGNGQTFTGTTNENGVFTQGDLQPATYTVSVGVLEGFDTPDASEIVVEENTQNSATFTYLEKSLIPIYGVSWVNDGSTTMTRTDDSVGMTYSISKGKVTSDFDHVFPYNQMKRQVINGNTFVYVPEMWFRVKTDADQKITSIAVSENQGTGNNWYKTRPFYYGAYGASSNGKILKSVSGASRLYSITRSVARTRAMATGTGYHQRDLYSYTILMFLWWIEFANKNSESIMTGSVSGKKTGGTNTIYNETEGNNFCVSGYDTSTFQMVWHGIEDFVGNGYEFEDGITTNSSNVYAGDDYTKYDDYTDSSKMSVLSLKAPSASSGYCIEAFGWDENKPFLCIPIATMSDSTYTTGFCDLGSVSGVILFSGSGYSFTSHDAGLSCIAGGGASYSYYYIGCRLVKRV